MPDDGGVIGAWERLYEMQLDQAREGRYLEAITIPTAAMTSEEARRFIVRNVIAVADAEQAELKVTLEEMRAESSEVVIEGLRGLRQASRMYAEDRADIGRVKALADEWRRFAAEQAESLGRMDPRDHNRVRVAARLDMAREHAYAIFAAIDAPRDDVWERSTDASWQPRRAR